MHLIIPLCLSWRVCWCVFVPDGSVKKNFSGESRNRDRSQRASSDPQLKELCGSHTLEQTVNTHRTPWDASSCLFPVNSNNHTSHVRGFHGLMFPVNLLRVSLLGHRQRKSQDIYRRQNVCPLQLILQLNREF